MTANLRGTPTSKQVLAALPCEAAANTCAIEGDPRELKKVKQGATVRVEIVPDTA